MQTKRWVVVAVAAALLAAHGFAARATGGGLVVPDKRGDAPSPLDPSLNAGWADLTEFRVETTRNSADEATGLQFTYVTDEAPREDDEHRTMYHAAWFLMDHYDPVCRAELTIRNYRQGGPSGSGGSYATLQYQCEGDQQTVVFEADDLTMGPVGDDFALSITLPFDVLSQGSAAGRYAAGTVLEQLTASTGPLVLTVGSSYDSAGEPPPPVQTPGGPVCICPTAVHTYVIGT